MNSNAAPTSRMIFAEAALEEIPKILTLQDRNPHSPTYGCFDRNHWHYKVIDFPSGMAQEFAWPLALAWSLDLPGNRFYRSDTVKEWIRAGVLFAARSSHPDGSCDDYFPYERALGATAFSLLACLEASALIDLRTEEALRFFERRAHWLSERHETGRLSNHHALVALCLDVAGRLLNSDKLRRARDERLAQLLSWQTSEGWFPEYEGFEPGYDTLTLSCLARLHQSEPRPELEKAIGASVALLENFVHPDGSFGGEYGSRNTYNFFPHGFELAGRWLPQALAINDAFASGLSNGRAACFSDDRLLGHHAWNYFLTARDYLPRPDNGGASSREPETGVAGAPPTISPTRIELPQAGIIIERRESTRLYLAHKKGGTLKLFRDGELVLSDTGISLKLRNGRTAVTHLVDQYEHDVQADRITVRGAMGWAKQERMTPLKLILLRLINLTIGRVAPNLLRAALQKRLITGKKPAPFQFERVLEWTGAKWKITDRISAESWRDIASAGIGPDQTSIYIAMSRTFQTGQLQPWQDLTGRIRSLGDGEPLVLERIV